MIGAVAIVLFIACVVADLREFGGTEDKRKRG